MADNTEIMDVPELDENLETLMVQTIAEAQERMSKGEEVVPFTAILAGANVYEKTHVGQIEECFASAKETVEAAEGARCYVFCYDGFIETDEGDKDAIIVEGGVAGEAEGAVLGLIYEIAGDTLRFDEEICYIAEGENHLADRDPLPLVPMNDAE